MSLDWGLMIEDIATDHSLSKNIVPSWAHQYDITLAFPFYVVAQLLNFIDFLSTRDMLLVVVDVNLEICFPNFDIQRKCPIYGGQHSSLSTPTFQIQRFDYQGFFYVSELGGLKVPPHVWVTKGRFLPASSIFTLSSRLLDWYEGTFQSIKVQYQSFSCREVVTFFITGASCY